MVSLQINRQRDNLKMTCEANVIRLLNLRNSLLTSLKESTIGIFYIQQSKIEKGESSILPRISDDT
jgi:hypothetical protein